MRKNLIISLFSGVIYAIVMTIFSCFYYEIKSLIYICISFIFYFLSWSILFFAFIQVFIKIQSRKINKIAKDIGENILYSGLANHFTNVESAGGFIFITKDKIIFKSHSFNIKNHTTEILLKDISNVKPYNNWIIANGLEILHNGEKDKFVVNDRNKIIEILNAFIS